MMEPVTIRLPSPMAAEIARLAEERAGIDGADKATVIREVIAKGLGWRK